MLTIAGEGNRLLRLCDLNGDLDGGASVPGTVTLADDRAQDIARVGGHIIVRERQAKPTDKGQDQARRTWVSAHSCLQGAACSPWYG